MSDEYLWDGSGPPDPEVERLERLLAPLGHRGGPPALSRPAAASRALLAAAAVAAAVGATLLALRDAAPGWDVTAMAGRPTVGDRPLVGGGRWRVGEWLETDGAARAAADVGEIGRVVVGPASRVRLVDAGADEHRIALAEGRLHAAIFAPPLRFYVDAPAATAVDLGCEYTLEADAAGNGFLRVRVGWVGFEWDGRETFVPAGARCLTRAGRGPGTPFFETARPAFQEALARIDFEALDAEERAATLAVVLAQARRRDAMSLWHLLRRLPPDERPALYDRLAELVPPPAEIRREAALDGDPATLDLWWNALDLDDVTWWRRWKAGWPRPDAPSARDR